MSHNTQHKVIIWGPGEIGGATLRAVHFSEEFELVGVKVFSPHKDGKDAGELVGIGPIGITATTSKDKILALDADLVVLTPTPQAILQGIDDDVIDILESGKSVVTTAAYHNVSLSNWHNSARTPTERLRALTSVGGLATSDTERVALGALKALTSSRRLDKVTDLVLRGVSDRLLPARATAERLQQACDRGQSSLFGTGMHPTLMVERVLMRMSRFVGDFKHMHFTEALDFGLANESMWGGLDFLGFGRPVESLGPDFSLARYGDFYYGDLAGNVAHAAFGVGSDRVRFTTTVRGVPAARDFRVGATLIKEGTAAALQLTTRGYIDGHHFFTNDECWFLNKENALWGDVLPYGNPTPEGGYSWKVTGSSGTFVGQSSYDTRGLPFADHENGLTLVSVHSMLDAAQTVCEAPPGVIIDDARPSFRLAHAKEPELLPIVGESTRRVVLAGSGAVARALQTRAEHRGISTVAESDSADPSDTVVLAADDSADATAAAVTALLDRGHNVVLADPHNLGLSGRTDVQEAAVRGGATFYSANLIDHIVGQVAMTVAGCMTSASHVILTVHGDEHTAAWRPRSPEAIAELAGHVAGEIDVDPDAIEVTRSAVDPASGVLDEWVAAVDGAPLLTVAFAERGKATDRYVYTPSPAPLAFSLRVVGLPMDMIGQWDLTPPAGEDATLVGVANIALSAAATTAAAPSGVIVDDPTPRYQRDPRLGF